MIELAQSIKANFIKDIFTDNHTQRLTILPNDELRIVITIPHNVFEWFVDVFDTQDRKVHSNWIDHYGDTEANLKSEMKESVERFIKTASRNSLRLLGSSTPERSTLEAYVDGNWTTSLY
jgi:hypothetical protein